MIIWFFIKNQLGNAFQKHADGKSLVNAIGERFKSFIHQYTEDGQNEDELLNEALGELDMAGIASEGIAVPSKLLQSGSFVDSVVEVLKAPQNTHSIVGSVSLSIANSPYWNVRKRKITDNASVIKDFGERKREVETKFPAFKSEFAKGKLPSAFEVSAAFKEAFQVIMHLSAIKLDDLVGPFEKTVVASLLDTQVSLLPALAQGALNEDQVSAISKLYEEAAMTFPLNGDISNARDEIAAKMVECVKQSKLKAFVDSCRDYGATPGDESIYDRMISASVNLAGATPAENDKDHCALGLRASLFGGLVLAFGAIFVRCFCLALSRGGMREPKEGVIMSHASQAPSWGRRIHIYIYI